MSKLDLIKSVDFNKVQKIYGGKDNWCRCGCGGSYHQKEEKGFNRKKSMISNLTEDKVLSIESNSKYMNISLENNKAYTLYFQ